MKEIIGNDFITKQNIDIAKLDNIYLYGSRVYGCAGEESDYDFIAISDAAEQCELKQGNIDIQIYNINQFKDRLINHEISALECIFLPDRFVLKQTIRLDININKSILRKSISESSSHAFVKAKKKLIVEKDFDPYRGKKSLFHSLRIVLFGLQIAKYGKIVDYTEANAYWNNIVLNPCNDWPFYKDKYQPIHNKLLTDFRKVAPKD